MFLTLLSYRQVEGMVVELQTTRLPSGSRSSSLHFSISVKHRDSSDEDIIYMPHISRVCGEKTGCTAWWQDNNRHYLRETLSFSLSVVLQNRLSTIILLIVSWLYSSIIPAAGKRPLSTWSIHSQWLHTDTLWNIKGYSNATESNQWVKLFQSRFSQCCCQIRK